MNDTQKHRILKGCCMVVLGMFIGVFLLMISWAAVSVIELIEDRDNQIQRSIVE